MERRGQVDAAIYVNGKSVMAEEITAFSYVPCIIMGQHRVDELNGRLLKNIREERDLALSLVSLGFTPRQAFELISDSLIGEAQTQPSPGEGAYDASDRLEGEDVILWWNDITKDSRYSQWPSALGAVRLPVTVLIVLLLTC
jgi:UDP-glucose:glycoprotein glucosyltransferase